MRDIKDMVLKNNTEIESFLKEYDSNYNTHAYINKVYSMLNELKPGQSIVIAKLVSEQNLNMFIKSACLYIIECKQNNIEISNDYRIVKK